MSADEVPPLWVTFTYSRGIGINSCSMVWKDQTPAQLLDAHQRECKNDGWYRLGMVEHGVVMFPARAVLDINVRWATPYEISQSGGPTR